MDTLFQILPQNYNSTYDIQPFVESKELFLYFIIASILMLFILAYSKIIENSAITDMILPFLQSEQFTLHFYEVEKGNRLTKNIILLFVSLQIAKLIFPYLNHLQVFVDSFLHIGMKLILFTLIIFLLFHIKFLIFHSLSFLIPWKVDINYFIFIYIILLLIFGLAIFVINCLPQQLSNKQLWPAYLVCIAGFYLLLILKWVFVSMRFRLMSSVYFFLYICTLEIVPLIIAGKLIV